MGGGERKKWKWGGVQNGRQGRRGSKGLKGRGVEAEGGNIGAINLVRVINRIVRRSSR